MFAGCEFISASTAGIVNVELGFIPDFAILYQNHTGTNPNIWYWARGGTGKTFPNWTAARSIKHTGGTDGGSTLTTDTSGIDEYAGGDAIAATETANTAGKHVDRAGTAATVGHITAPGLAIPADHQTNSGRNLLVAWRNDQ